MIRYLVLSTFCSWQEIEQKCVIRALNVVCKVNEENQKYRSEEKITKSENCGVGAPFTHRDRERRPFLLLWREKCHRLVFLTPAPRAI
jgi:hypothetical protein